MKSKLQASKLPPMNRPTKIFSLVLFGIMAVILLLFLLLNPLGLPYLPGATTQGKPVVHGAVESALTVYQCPMHPQVIEAEPGVCPICGMELMPRDGAAVIPDAPEHEHGENQGTVQIDPVQVQNIGVVSVPATRGEMARTVRTVGILDFNADRISWVNTKFSGWIEKVKVTYVGQTVVTGETLFEIYSPELVTTQDEYLRALDYAGSLRTSGRPEALKQAESLLRSTRERLLYWGISQEQIGELENRRTTSRRLPVVSPVDGVVVEVMDQALEGMFVEPGMNLYRIADMSSVWVHADVYESDLPWVRAGQPAEVSFSYDPETSFAGEILFLYPQVSQETRTLKICVQVPNLSGDLRAGMYSDVLIKGPAIQDAILIPNSSVLRSGERDLVFIDLGGGRFQPREVKLGIRGEADLVQVLAGVQPDELVVTQGQFMLDSESRVQEAIAQFMDRRPPPAMVEEPSSSSPAAGDPDERD
jgi:RND family efflux transporter MFP subunit